MITKAKRLSQRELGLKNLPKKKYLPRHKIPHKSVVYWDQHQKSA